ncbi:MAG: PEP/pyruvate-binding domain-containing protein [Thermoleophilia bacterium]
MTKRTYNLLTLPLDAVDLAGPKAMNLARLARMGLPVPPAGVITVAAYREHLETPGPAEALRVAISRRDPGALAALRARIVQQPLSEDLRRELHVLYDSLGAGTMAVRSSAVAEDLPERSFAGQHGTYFRGDLNGCLLAVKHCWASLWSDSAFTYRDYAGIEHSGAAMAVILQPLVAAECAGVAFTADPLTGATDRVVVESCFGLGEALVSGKVCPDRFVFSVPGLKLLERTINRKEVEVLTGFDGRVYQWTTAPHRASAPSLSDTSAHELARHAVVVADGFGDPVDVEWAIEDGRAYLLQARPITALRRHPPVASAGALAHVRETAENSDTVWSNMNTGEVLPGVVTPATYSVIVKVGDIIVEKLFARLGVRFGGAPLFGRFAGRVYFNVSAITAGFAAIPAISRPDVNKLLGGMQERGNLPLPTPQPVTARSTVRFLIGLPGFLAWSLAHGSRKAPAFAAHLRAETRALTPPDLAAASDEDLAESLKRLTASLDDLTDVLAFAGVAMANFTNLQTLCRRWFAEEGPTLANRLVTGLGDLDSARTAVDLWALARLAAAEPALKAALLEAPPGSDPRPVARALAGSGELFVRAWDAFLDEHGHHARGEIELYTPRWRENPGHLLMLLAGYLRTEGEDQQAVRQKMNARVRLALTADMCARLRDPIRRRLFDYVVRQAQLGSSARENLKSEAVRRIAAMRAVMVALNRRLVERQSFGAEDDIFFLHLDEIELLLPAVGGAAGDRVTDGEGVAGGVSTMRELVARRRADFERDRRVDPPAVFVGGLSPQDLEPGAVVTVASTNDVLKGLPVSSGIVEGPARVIPTVDAVDTVLPGEVLVVPFTDPGWAPFLLPAAGIIMNMGGLLSHGSIIAREYGIPAVVNVGPATSMIRTGQRVRVDGDRGVVTILD